MSVQPVSAAQAIGEVLQSPDDLLKIVAFRRKLEKEKASIDARLKVGIKEHIEATRDGLRKLLNSRADVQAMKDELFAIEEECSSLQNAVPVFDQISRVSLVHRNFQQTREIVENLRDLQSKLDSLKDMLYADRGNITGPASNLLTIHYHVNRLEGFRNETLHMAKKASNNARTTLDRIFQPLDEFIKEFDNYIFSLSRNILSIIRAGHPEVIVKLVKIAEIERIEDEKVDEMRVLKKVPKHEVASQFRSMQAEARIPKRYQSKIIANISDSVKGAFREAYKRDEKSPSAFLEHITWMYQDIIRIEDVVPCFPPGWKIYSLYIGEYHKALNATLEKIMAAGPEGGFYLVLHDWLKEYEKDMADLNVPADLLKPPLMNGKEQTLIDEYSNLITEKIENWSKGIMDRETQQFISRSKPPEIDEDSLYGLQGAVDLFQMINQQTNVAQLSNQGGVLSRVVVESSRVMRETQEQWVKLIESEYKKQVEKPDENSGLGEYCIALANDQIKCADYAEAISARFVPLVSEKYQIAISNSLNEAIDGYLDVAKKCTQTLIEIVFNDLKPATKQLFQPAWYEGNIGQIVETLRDYMTDYQDFLNPSILELLVEDLMDAFLVSYLTSLANTSKLRIPAAFDRIKEDVSLAIQFFVTLTKAKEVEQHFDVLEKVLSLLEASKDLVFLSFWSFAKVHGPNIAFVENLLKARDDFDRSFVSDIINKIKRKVEEEGLTDPPEPTIMKKITKQNTIFSRFQWP